MKKDFFKIAGMTCAACQSHVYNSVKDLDGIINCSVNLLTNSMEVEYDSNRINDKSIIQAVKKSGYDAELLDNDKNNNDIKENIILDVSSEVKGMVKRLVLSFVFLVPLFYLSMGYMMDFPIFFFKENPIALGLTLMILSFIIMVINKKYFISGVKSIINRTLNMDTLIALGSGIAFLYSIILLFIISYYATINYDISMIHKYAMNFSFETAGMVPTLITVGKTLEAYSKGKTTNALKSLINLTPKKALVLRDNKEIEVLIDDVLVDDIFIVRPGDRIPVDGIVFEGYSQINESMLTGESLPVDKLENSKVFQGTLNISGELKCKATNVKNTALKQIIDLVFNATQSKAKISRISDVVAGIFVPVVVLISIITFTLWMILGTNYVKENNELLITFALTRAISVLVISCPCALGLATPVAIMVASGVGAKNGILYKNAEALENYGKTDFILLDKTGTITKGDISVSLVIPYNISEDELLVYASSLESKSTHPVATSIVSYSIEKGLGQIEVKDFNTIIGSGVYATINGKKIYGVDYKYAKKLINIDDEISKKYDEISKLGITPLMFIYDNRLIGIIGVKDIVKEDSKKAIEEFINLGITPIMITGDNYNVASNIAKEVGIKNYFSNVLPSDKSKVVEILKKYGNVSMVGDGINDSVALSMADTGVAIGNGSDIAIDSSSIVLVKSSLMDAVYAIKLSRQTLKNIKENLFWAFIYNLIMIPIAAGAFVFTNIDYLVKLKPWYGAISMSLSSIFVVLNSLRLNLFNKNRKMNRGNKVLLTDDIYNEINNEINKDNDIFNENNVIIDIEGMMCDMCKKHVFNALSNIDGVKNVIVSLEDNNAKIYALKNVSDEIIISSIEDEGYKVKNIKRKD